MKNRSLTLLIIATWIITACSARQAIETPPSVTITPMPRTTVTASPTQWVFPTPTQMQISLETTVWEQEPHLPILLYHYFVSDEQESKDFTQIRLGDFHSQLEKLYDAGYSLVQVEEWLKGNMIVPKGRRPLAITIDDLFLSNQLELDSSGNPLPDTGLGVLWQFSQEHPDFGFEVMLFVNFGDKSYGVADLEVRKLKQARSVVWCMEHGARIYNHTFNHIDLRYSTPEELEADLTLHDTYLREILALMGRTDLIPQLGNMLAVPYSWPLTERGYEVMQGYTTPEGIPMQAVFGSAYFKNAPPLPPPYTPGIDLYNIKRFEVNNDALNYLVRNKDSFPAAYSCTLAGLDELKIVDPTYLGERLKIAIDEGTCRVGIYVIQGLIFDAQTSTVIQIYP